MYQKKLSLFYNFVHKICKSENVFTSEAKLCSGEVVGISSVAQKEEAEERNTSQDQGNQRSLRW